MRPAGCGLDRPALGEIIFSDPSMNRALELGFLCIYLSNNKVTTL